jgi:hypothetical protein
MQIDPAGGELVHPSGAKLIVPVGALASSTSISWCGVAPPSAAALGGAPLAQAFEAGPSGQTFAAPVEIVVPFDASRLPAGSDPGGVQVRMGSSGAAAFGALQSTVDVASGVVHASALALGQFVAAPNPTPLAITTPPTLPGATIGVPYALTFQATGGAPPYGWNISPAELPRGFSISPTGVLSGLPSTVDRYAFSVTVVDTRAHAVQLAVTLTVLPAANPVPGLLQLTPSSVAQGSATTTIALAGASFVPTSQVLWDGAAIPTTFVTTTGLAASVAAARLAAAGTHAVSVANPPPAGGTSAALTFSVTAAKPVDMSINPADMSISPADMSINPADMSMSWPDLSPPVGDLGNQCPSGWYYCPNSGIPTYPNCMQLGNCCSASPTFSMCTGGVSCGTICHCPGGQKFCNGACISCSQTCNAIVGSRIGCCTPADCPNAMCFSTTSFCN